MFYAQQKHKQKHKFKECVNVFKINLQDNFAQLAIYLYSRQS